MAGSAGGWKSCLSWTAAPTVRWRCCARGSRLRLRRRTGFALAEFRFVCGDSHGVFGRARAVFRGHGGRSSGAPGIGVEFFRALSTKPIDIALGVRTDRDDPTLGKASSKLYWGGLPASGAARHAGRRHRRLRLQPTGARRPVVAGRIQHVVGGPGALAGLPPQAGALSAAAANRGPKRLDLPPQAALHVRQHLLFHQPAVDVL